ncbi:hypothetical protein [Pontibacter lucknowensis]|uniref:Uncharacterized protein n=1 Tax=Pontibacter lucknowensis TaxID=1077936 RepID=A0A1N6ZIK0_9BACT|nr:hypothetical protein [Pontibacter lucknowensis]SIR26551.1 hypothetical protein SAMN05421545_3007 [Pontibacter lucknowensis]
MKSNLYLLLLSCLFLGACEKDPIVEEEPLATDCLVQQVISYYTSEYNKQPQSRMKHVFSYDNQNRITQIVRTGLESSTADYEAVTIYHYDDKGRIAEVILTSTYDGPGNETIYTYEYNEQGQLLVRRHFSVIVNCPTVELAKVEYTYGATNEPDSSAFHSMRPWQGSDLFHNLSFKSTYANGVMTRVKTYPIDPEFQFLPYEDDIRYDTRKAPFSASPAQPALMLQYETDGFVLNLPQLHNVTSVTRWSEDGRINFAYDIQYTYSDKGYPLTARQKYSQGNFVEYNFEYSYTCSK